MELFEYSLKSGNEIITLKITDYTPKRFKFRSLDILKNEIILYKTLEYQNC